MLKEDPSCEVLFFELAIEDIRRSTDLFRPIHDRTDGVDGWVSLEVSPLLARNTADTLTATKTLDGRAGRPNLFIKIPGTFIIAEPCTGVRDTACFDCPVDATMPKVTFSINRTDL
jgi:Transaldolase/Fructose-6-phosphate aldolase